MIGQSHQMIFTADIGIRQDRFSKNRQIIPVLDQLSSNSLIRYTATFQFNIYDLIILDLKKIKLLSKLRDLERIKKPELIYLFHMQFQLLHQYFHTFQFPLFDPEKKISAGKLAFQLLNTFHTLISCKCIDRYCLHIPTLTCCLFLYPQCPEMILLFLCDTVAFNGFLDRLVMSPDIHPLRFQKWKDLLILFCQRCSKIPGSHHIYIIFFRADRCHFSGYSGLNPSSR